ncbi:FtsX-like permease family protein [Rossellomorea marisflavi]|uniref:Putative hemin transport system permease protein HrtB n=1 Tax=Rossellomorea marisflavi TaxID=189381 RepID=A0A5D4RYT1_9BACI|nr:FtsX-like permease family protein [Rossellomorea marisflavi]TYS54732.1 FtsX-like permease family protein [Rossellomorea marisflavi]
MKIFHLALSHIRKSKSAAVSLFLFIVIASVLLNIGLMVITQLNPFLDEKNEELQDPHTTFVMNRELYRPDIGTYLSDRPGVTNTEKEDVISMDIANFTYGDGDLASTIVILNADAPRDIGAMKLIEKKGDKGDDAIFVPLSFKTNGGYSLGDDLAITYRGDEYRYRIAGFFETTVMGTTNMGVMKLMLPRESFKELSEELGGKADGIMLSARMNDSADAPDLAQKVMQQFNENASSVLQRDFETMKNVSLLTITIIATLLVAFAAINVLVSLIVIRFRISNSIEDGMENIGVLKAIGYTSAQILASIALQFLLIVVGASLVGVALSYTLMPFFGETISSLSGLVWDQHIALGVNGISIVVIVLAVGLVTLL